MIDVDARYFSEIDTKTDMDEHLPRFVELVLELEAKKVIELGVRSGISTVGWLYGLQQTGGHLWSVDIHAQPYVAENWTFIQGDDLSVDVLEQLPDDADIVFIDSSHAYGHTVGELSVYGNKVRQGGRIVLHDTELIGPSSEFAAPGDPEYPVKVAVTEFCETYGLHWENRTNSYGLGEIWMP